MGGLLKPQGKRSLSAGLPIPTSCQSSCGPRDMGAEKRGYGDRKVSLEKVQEGEGHRGLEPKSLGPGPG